MLKLAQDIISLPIELPESITDSKFRLVHVASQRVRQLSAGVPIQVSTQSIKDTTVSLEEALSGRLRVLVGEEAKKAKEEFQKQLEQARLEEDLSAREEEIRKELSVYLSESREDGEISGEQPTSASDVPEEETSEDQDGDEFDQETTESEPGDNSEE